MSKSNQSDETSVEEAEEGQIFEIYIAKQLKRHPEDVDKRNSRARTEIVVNVNVGTVIKVELRKKSSPSLPYAKLAMLFELTERWLC